MFRVANLAHFTGQIIKIDTLKSYSLITVNVGCEDGQKTDNIVHIYAFGQPKTIVDRFYKPGTVASFNCSVQENPEKTNERFYQSLVLYKVRPASENLPVTENRFAFLANVYYVKQAANGRMTAGIRLCNKSRDKLNVWVDLTDEQAQIFKAVRPGQRVQLFGHITTGERIVNGTVKSYEVCCVDKFNVLRPPQEQKDPPEAA